MRVDLADNAKHRALIGQSRFRDDLGGRASPVTTAASAFQGMPAPGAMVPPHAAHLTPGLAASAATAVEMGKLEQLYGRPVPPQRAAEVINEAIAGTGDACGR